MKRIKLYRLLLLIPVLLGWGCADEYTIGDDPYGGGKDPLGVKFKLQAPEPEQGYPSQEVLFAVEGFNHWCDPVTGAPLFDFFISDEKADVLEMTDTTILVRVPENLSSGTASIILQGQVFYGPRFEVLGSVTVDEAYNFQYTDNTVYCILPHRTNQTIYYIGGAFANAVRSNESRYGVAGFGQYGNILAKGSTDFKTNGYQNQGLGQMFVGSVNSDYVRSMSRFSDGKILMSGSIHFYEKDPASAVTGGNYTLNYLYNLVVANADFSIDRIDAEILDRDMFTPITRKAYSFQGGTDEPVVRSFVTTDDRVVAVGNFTQHYRIDFSKSTPLFLEYETTNVRSVIRMDRYGILDESYRSAGSYTGANNTITDAWMEEDDCVVLIGQFTAFDGVAVPGIVRLTADGEIDREFLENIGTAANGTLNSARYSPHWQKTVICGNFTQFAGRPFNGIVLINRDGSIDETFRTRSLSGGAPNFGAILSDGKVVVSGTFTKYDGITRRGFLILDADGKATQYFNVPGKFVGQIYDLLETKSSMNNNGLLLVGSISRFNDKKADNAVMLETHFEY